MHLQCKGMKHRGAAPKTRRPRLERGQQALARRRLDDAARAAQLRHCAREAAAHALEEYSLARQLPPDVL